MSHSATAGRPKGETAKAITSPCMPQRSPVNKANRAPIRQRKDRAQNTHEEKEKAKAEMQKMLDYVEKLDELDTSEVEPMSHIFQDENVFREDVVTNGDNKEAMLANAPKAKEGQYQVPKTIG